MDSLGAINLFNQGGLAFLRDAWLAAQFAGKRDAEQVRSLSANWPDFELKIAGRVEAFEAVEADAPERHVAGSTGKASAKPKMIRSRTGWPAPSRRHSG